MSIPSQLELKQFGSVVIQWGGYVLMYALVTMIIVSVIYAMYCYNCSIKLKRCRLKFQVKNIQKAK